MQILGEGKDIHSHIRGTMQTEPPVDNHDFFAPVGPQDPHTKRPTPKVTPPRFNFKVFYLTGPGSGPEEELKYIEVMNKICTGEYTNSVEETYHDKDGTIKVFLKWLEWPNGGNPNTAPKDEELDALMEEPDRKKKNKKKKNADGDELSPATDPQVNF